MTPATYNIPSHYKGDTFDAITFTLKEDGVAVDFTGATIKMNFRRDSPTGNIQQSMTIGTGITVSNAVGGVFVLDSFLNDWDAKRYYYDTQVTFPGGADGIVRTYFKGYQDVKQDTTNG
jgi:hypothetical protein